MNTFRYFIREDTEWGDGCVIDTVRAHTYGSVIEDEKGRLLYLNANLTGRLLRDVIRKQSGEELVGLDCLSTDRLFSIGIPFWFTNHMIVTTGDGEKFVRDGGLRKISIELYEKRVKGNIDLGDTKKLPSVLIEDYKRFLMREIKFK